jgi:ATP-dependent RNA helicase DDX3X
MSNENKAKYVSEQNVKNGSETTDVKKYVPPHLRNKPVETKSTSSYSSGYGSQNNGNNSKQSFFEKPQPTSSRWKNFESSSNSNGYGGYSNRYIEDKEEDLFMEEESIGINFDKYNDIPVEISGEDCPDPLETFDKCELYESVAKNVQRAKYHNPTPIQKFSIPSIMKGRDLMACAQTGSGKTCAFLLPVVNSMLTNGTSKSSKQFLTYPTCIIMTPTRELALQIHVEAKRFAYKTGIIPQVVYGGDPIKDQMRELNKGCDILVATPGRLIDLLERGKISLAGVKFLILDEADRMLDMGFEPQIRQIVEKEDLPGNEGRQTLMFSATFPKEIQQLASDFLDNYIFLTVGTVGATSSFITQKIEFVEEQDKKDVLLGLLKTKEGRTLVFVETKRSADELEYFLYKQGLKADSIHGDRTQQERLQSLNAFKSGETSILVATSVAARGLDIDGVTHVINYDLPSACDDYVHRIGRTGRKGNSGLATSFYNDKNKNIMKDLVKLLDQAEQEIPSWLIKEMEYTRKDFGKSGRGGKKQFGSRDYRNKSSKTYSHNSSGSGSSSQGSTSNTSSNSESNRNYFQSQNKQWK